MRTTLPKKYENAKHLIGRETNYWFLVLMLKLVKKRMSRLTQIREKQASRLKPGDICRIINISTHKRVLCEIDSIDGNMASVRIISGIDINKKWRVRCQNLRKRL